MTPLLTYAIEKQHFADVREVSARRVSLSRKALDPRPLTRLCSPRPVQLQDQELLATAR